MVTVLREGFYNSPTHEVPGGVQAFVMGFWRNSTLFCSSNTSGTMYKARVLLVLLYSESGAQLPVRSIFAQSRNCRGVCICRCGPCRSHGSSRHCVCASTEWNLPLLQLQISSSGSVTGFAEMNDEGGLPVCTAGLSPIVVVGVACGLWLARSGVASSICRVWMDVLVAVRHCVSMYASVPNGTSASTTATSLSPIFLLQNLTNLLSRAPI